MKFLLPLYICLFFSTTALAKLTETSSYDWLQGHWKGSFADGAPIEITYRKESEQYWVGFLQLFDKVGKITFTEFMHLDFQPRKIRMTTFALSKSSKTEIRKNHYFAERTKNSKELRFELDKKSLSSVARFTIQLQKDGSIREMVEFSNGKTKRSQLFR